MLDVRALVTAEFTDDGVRRLRALGYEVVRAGWGVARQQLDRDALVAAAQGAELLLTEIEAVDADVLAGKAIWPACDVASGKYAGNTRFKIFVYCDTAIHG